MKPLAYLAGPYSSPDPVENMHYAIMLATAIREANVVTPVVPHLTGLWHLVCPAPYEDWLAYDLELMLRCDIVFRFGGASSGADREVQAALDAGIPVVHNVESLYAWAKAQR